MKKNVRTLPHKDGELGPNGESNGALLRKKTSGNGAGANKNINVFKMNAPLETFDLQQSRDDQREDIADRKRS